MRSCDFTPTTWRLIKSGTAPGAWNMAVDEALLQSVGAKESLPVLRLYAWSPPCISLGYAQPISDVHQETLRQNGWDLVRRLTGGRAILHTDELTYAVIAPNGEPRLAGGILESYLRLSRALLKAVKDLGVPAQAAAQVDRVPQQGKVRNPVCFQVPSNYEIIVHGKKILGSAQARKKEGILQHGTLPLQGDLTRVLQVLNRDRESSRSEVTIQGKNELLRKATTLEAVLDTPPTWDDAASAFVEAFEKSLNISFLEDELSPEEQTRTQKLVNEKYAHPGWTGRI